MGSQYGTTIYGSTPYGGSALSGGAAPILQSSDPADGATMVAQNAPVELVLFDDDAIDLFSINVTLEGQQAIVNGVFAAGYAGTIVDGGTTITVTISTHPDFGSLVVDVYVGMTDCSGLAGAGAFSFTVALPTISNLLARTWCDGKEIGLSWTNPTPAPASMIIRRSKFAFCSYITDPGENIYVGVPIATYTDSGLEEDTFYYYTIFIAWVATYYAPDSHKVMGLSIKDYYTRFGDYVYRLLPKTYRQRDADVARGTNQYLLKNYCRVIQCSVNLYRGWFEGLIHLRDVDLMPSGRLGEAVNQQGILAAQNYDLGFTAEKSYDAGLLRRMALAMIGISKKKGICQSYVDLIKAFTTWDSRCDQMIDPLCGINRLITSWDGTSYFNYVSLGTAADPLYSPAAYRVDSTTPGTLLVNTAILADYGAGQMPTTASGAPTAASVISDLGDFACIDDVSINRIYHEFTFTDPTAYIRSEIVGTATNVATVCTLTAINVGSYPWQFPAPAIPPVYGLNAFVGLKLMDNTGAIFDVVASDGYVLTLSGAAADGAVAIASGFDGAVYATRTPKVNLRFIIGEMSLTAHTIWDLRLFDELYAGPWSVTAGIGSGGLGYGFSGTPADLTMWISGEHSDSDVVLTVNANELRALKTWIVNQWVGYYVLPNWDQTRLFRIVSNTASKLFVVLEGGPGMDTVSEPGANFVILTAENALKYAQLTRLLPSFVPVDTRPLVKFE